MRTCFGGGRRCWEPTVAAGPDGTLLVAIEKAHLIARSLDGGATFDGLAPPPRPVRAHANSSGGDAFLQFDAAGRLYLHSMWSHPFDTPVGSIGTGATFGGFRIARSDDLGATWTLNSLITRDDQPVLFAAVNNDRQWLATGPGDRVYLTFAGLPVANHIAASDDGGATFGPFVPYAVGGDAFPKAGGIPAVREDGLVALPYFGLPGASLRIALAPNGEAPFHYATRPLLGDEIAQDQWPSADFQADGTLAVAWSGTTGLYVTTYDPETDAWGPSLRVNDGTKDASDVPPHLRTRADGRLDVAWFDLSSDGHHVMFARFEPTLANVERVVVASVVGDVWTDFAHFDRLADGRIALVYATEAQTVHLAVETVHP